jgi:hypothetical protein
MADVKLPFGLRDGEYLHIDQVDRGLRCNCRCPGCDAELVAKKGDGTAHHFAHRAKSDCTYTPETALHDYSKRLIARQPSFRTPNLHIVVRDSSYGFILEDMIPGKQHSIKASAFEKSYEDIVPDVQLQTDSGLIFVEIAVTHFVDQKKRSKLRRIGVPTIEINLSSVAMNSSLEAIEHAVLQNASIRKWAYHPEELERQSRLWKELQEKITQYELEHWRNAPEESEIEADNMDEDDDYEGWDLLQKAVEQYDGDSIHQWLQSIPPKKRAESYKSLSHLDKLTYHCFLLDRRPETLPLFFNRREASGPPFLCPSIIWRTAVFFRFVVANKHVFGLSDVVQWCSNRYETFSFGSSINDLDTQTQPTIDIDGEVTAFLLEIESEGYLESDGFIPKRRRYIPTINYLPNWNRFRRQINV